MRIPPHLFTVICRFCHQSVVGPKNGVFYLDRLSGADSGISVFCMNRPQTKNAIGAAFLSGLRNSMEIVAADPNSRVVILKSDVVGAFCSGADLKERAAMNETETFNFVRGTRKLFDDLSNLPVPVIAAMDGIALGGGLEVALACDIRVAATTAKMGLVETRLAIIPGAGGTQRLPRLVGTAVAKELMFTARVLDAPEAHRLGMLNHLKDQNDQGDAAFRKSLELAREILSKGPVAVKMVKRAVNAGCAVDFNSGLAIEDLCYSQVIPTHDRVEGLRAFKEKRAPVFKGE